VTEQLASRIGGQEGGCDLLPVDSLVQPLNEPVGAHLEHAADSEQRGHGDRATSLDLLPVPSRKAEGNHIFLRIATIFPKLLHSLAEGAKELGVVDHAPLSTGTRAERPRAD